MHIYFDNNVLVELVTAGVDPVASLLGTEFMIAVTPDLSTEYQQAIESEKVDDAERDLCRRLLSASREIGIFGFGEARSGYSGFDHGMFATAETITTVAGIPITARLGKPIPKNRTDAFLVALASGAVVITNDTGAHWNRARAAGHNVFTWAEVSGCATAPSELAVRLSKLLMRHDQDDAI